MRQIDEIIIHCSATKPSWFAGRTSVEKLQEIRRWHVEQRGWSDIGYHFVIDRDGTVLEGRPVERQGAHVSGHNKTTIGVCLIGGLRDDGTSSAHDSFLDNFTQKQRAAVLDLIDDLMNAHPGIKRVVGHNAYAAKDCPCFQVSDFLVEVEAEEKAAAEKAQTTTVASQQVAAGGLIVAALAAIAAFFNEIAAFFGG